VVIKIEGLTETGQPLYFTGADEQDRTADLLITNQLLYRLSYIGIPSIRYIPERVAIYRKFLPLSRFSCKREQEKGRVHLDFRCFSGMISAILTILLKFAREIPDLLPAVPETLRERA
jgi:hypothetical protein